MERSTHRKVKRDWVTDNNWKTKWVQKESKERKKKKTEERTYDFKKRLYPYNTETQTGVEINKILKSLKSSPYSLSTNEINKIYKKSFWFVSDPRLLFELSLFSESFVKKSQLNLINFT